MFGQGTVNKQSAEEAYKQIEELKKQLDDQKAEFQKAMEVMNKLDVSTELKDANLELNSLRKAVEEKDKLIKEYQDLNQRLFLRVSTPVDEKPLKTEEELEEERAKAEVDAIEEKIKQMNEETVKENGGN